MGGPDRNCGGHPDFDRISRGGPAQMLAMPCLDASRAAARQGLSVIADRKVRGVRNLVLRFGAAAKNKQGIALSYPLTEGNRVGQGAGLSIQ